MKRDATGQIGMFERAADVLEEYVRSGRRPRDLLANAFASDRDAAETQQRITRAVYRCVQQQRRIEFVIGSVRSLPERVRARVMLLATLVAEGDLAAVEAERRAREFGRLRIDWSGIADADARIARLEDPIARFGVMHSIPDWLAARLLRELPDDADELMRALNAAPPRTIRANLLRTSSRDTLAAELARADIRTTPAGIAPHALRVDGAASLFVSDAFRQGSFEQQDEASQLCAEIVAPPPRGRVLDACCGGGGKTLALAALLGNRGEILATDVHDGRLAALVERRRRAGVDIVRSMPLAEGEWPGEVDAFARRADRILLDVPCSGVGSWRRRTDARWTLSAEQCEAMHTVQSDLLDRALDRAAPGARVIYATCTVFADENERQIEAALARHAGFEIVPIIEILGRVRAEPISDASGRFLRLWPHRHGTDGFFAAVLRRPRAR